jgi:DNA-binding MarR family transcriptional regulator/GNAT superfamily N-acetyltransferase
MASSVTRLDSRVAQVRRFNRFYTRAIGVLNEHHLQSPLSLSEVRVLYELAHADPDRPASARVLASGLGIDEGYLSRILRGFVQRGWLRRQRSPSDRRRTLLSLTARGRKALAPLESRSHAQSAALLSALAPQAQQALTASMRTIEQLLEPAARIADREQVGLREPLPGDLGWIIHRHGELYAQEYGYDARFEALVARIVADFVDHLRPGRERCWIAVRSDAIVGAVLVVRKTDSVAKLRLLYVEPAARGMGVGALLVDECIRFARATSYRKLMLWTQSELVAARALYARAGFEKRTSEPHQSFGRDLVAETWELRL